MAIGIFVFALVWFGFEYWLSHQDFRLWRKNRYRIDFHPKSLKIWVVTMLHSIMLIVGIVVGSAFYHLPSS